MTIKQALAGVVFGVGLAPLPFLPYAHLGGRGAAHADHEPRHGGQLGMVGDHHIEVVRRRGEVHVFVSDAWRRPVQPDQVWVTLDGVTTPLVWRDDRMVGPDAPSAGEIDVAVLLFDGVRLATSFEL